MGTKSHNSIWAQGTGGSNERSHKISVWMWRFSQKCAQTCKSDQSAAILCMTWTRKYVYWSLSLRDKQLQSSCGTFCFGFCYVRSSLAANKSKSLTRWPTRCWVPPERCAVEYHETAAMTVMSLNLQEAWNCSHAIINTVRVVRPAAKLTSCNFPPKHLREKFTPWIWRMHVRLCYKRHSVNS